MKAVVVFRIDRRSGVATYLQIVRQVEQALRMGTLKEGDRLPTAAQVAADTKVNPNTTLKAYRELERAGLAEVRQGAGTFVTRSLAPAQAASESPLRASLAGWLNEARSQGLSSQEVLALFESVHAAVYPGETDG
ncbi:MULTISPECIES: GntR family transcriptional regulator [unclassified Streptomyces]|uniref:GntR family transcriptional regulator n=1 Tax=unclassified Streptomyces TaxID=2593676 RepID=UPI00224D8F6D|nr:MULTISPECIES: GntR family transcriptional regulator [unclassified Streptomyces]WSP56707.1 GntR family transcriptional regulator [Streptomyces sp. NBC_01241]WSU22575.1 GntR family transcriptional regulator [Streptomyces sp. NBC_01108]MCX4788456.1 GntR family transcriptional regulator [Streptomyces sp. NBC_01221]MCX4795783.1 GntR family transcriptional regulator [Streptomyces sp. NBC_01242]WSJ37067.1 GntR family transcriptional regulator [Streptomyces sp. NBC_01321]